MRRNIIIAVFGRKGLGKTYLVKWIVRRSRRMILIDTLNEYNNGTVVYDTDALFDMAMESEFRIIFRPLNDEDFEYALDLAIAVGKLTLVIDEIDQHTTSYSLPEKLRWVIHYGRHYNVSLVVAARMPQRIRTDITAQADVILSFQQQGKATISYLKDFTDLDLDLYVRDLEAHKFISIIGDFSLDNPPDLP